MQLIKENLNEKWDRKNNYVDRNKFLKEFQVGEQMYLCIKLKKSSLWIG